MPARNGATAALLVKSGWTCIADALSGKFNLFESYPPNKPEEAVNKLGEEYGVMGMYIKKWTVGHPMQAPLDAMYYLLQEHPFQPDQVEHVLVRMARAYVTNNRDMPDISLQHMLAVMIIDKNATFHSAHDKPRMKDPVVLGLRATVELMEDEDFKRRGIRQGAVVEVTLKDGTKLSKRAEAVRGSPKNPMTTEEVCAKARMLITPVLGPSTATKLIDKVLKLENAKDIRELRPLLQKA
jgi:2-methylcitrate dehydratase PrpD